MDVFGFERFCEVLTAFVSGERRRNPRFTLKVLARRHKAVSAAMLYKMARGIRIPSDATLERLAEAMQLAPDERRFVYLLVRRERGAPDADFLEGEINGMRRRHRLEQLDGAGGDLNRWFFPVIASMTRLGDFQHEPAWIARRLQGGLTPATVTAALETLVKAGILQVRADGSLERLAKAADHAGTDTLNGQVHGDFLELAVRALQAVPRPQRHVVGAVLPVKRDRLAALFAAMSDFRLKAASEFEADAADDVFYLSMHCFPLTQIIT